MCMAITKKTNITEKLLFFSILNNYICNKQTPSSLRDISSLNIEQYVKVLR